MSESTQPVLRKSRKFHTCDWCGKGILPDEKYFTWCWFEDGTASTVKSHGICKAAAERHHNEWGEAWFDRMQPKGCDCGYENDCCSRE